LWENFIIPNVAKIGCLLADSECEPKGPLTQTERGYDRVSAQIMQTIMQIKNMFAPNMSWFLMSPFISVPDENEGLRWH
jgi:hypothetical protein